MMTQEQWEKRLKSFVQPFFTRDEASVMLAYFRALAKAIGKLEEQMEETINQTMIDKCDREHLSVHAAERGVPFSSKLATSILREQVKKFSVPSSKPEIKAALDKITGTDATYIREWFEKPESHLNRGVFLNRGNIQLEEIQNTFTVFIKKLDHRPFAFVGRSFVNRADFASSMEVPEVIFDNINETVESMKALGTEFAVMERQGA